MAFHPQMDGLSERKNQWVEQYLRLVTSALPNDWTHWLALATAVHNNQRNSTTGLSPNQILLGYNLSLIPSEKVTMNNNLVEKCMTTLLEKRAQAIDTINQSARKDQGGTLKYKVGEQVWLEATHLKLHHQSTKLAPKYYGSFVIAREISPVAYQLKLPTSWGIHNVFHASLLSSYCETTAFGPNFSQPPSDLIGGEEKYEVERVLDHRCHGRSRQLQYFIKWKGYPKSDNTWEPADQVHMPDLVKAYHRSNPLKHKRGRVIAVNHIHSPSHLHAAKQLSCLHKVPPTPAAKMMPPSWCRRPLHPSRYPSRRWTTSSETFPIWMPPLSREYWAELLARCDTPRTPTIEKWYDFAPKLRRLNATSNIMKSNTLNVPRGTRPTSDEPPHSTSWA